MPLRLGSAFENGTDQYEALKKHLWFIISAPDPNGRVVIVNLTSWHGRKTDDPACIVDVGEHEFIHHKSYVNYADARSAEIGQLESLRQQDFLTLHADASPALLRKIWNGAAKSKYMKGKYLAVLKSQGRV